MSAQRPGLKWVPWATRTILLAPIMVFCIQPTTLGQSHSAYRPSWSSSGVRLTLTDTPIGDNRQSPEDTDIDSLPIEVHLGDEIFDAGNKPADLQQACPSYPSRVSHAVGRPHKPLIDRSGDIDRHACPPLRYEMADCERAGHPHEVAWWAKCPINKQYSAWYVGGGTAWILPKRARPKQRDEGTWGLDYDGLFHPRRVWLNWSCHRSQGGLGAYETEREPGFLAGLLHQGHE